MRQSMLDWVACSSPIWSKPGSLATQTVWKVWRQPMSPKITDQHRSRPAYIYVRQPTNAQVLHHQESTERQYALRAMALELGWRESAIRTLDRDLGMTGTEMTRREDFKTLVADADTHVPCLDGSSGRSVCAGSFPAGALASRLASAAGVVGGYRDAGGRRKRVVRSDRKRHS